MQFIQHPSYVEQKNEIELILSKLTVENINKLLKQFDMYCIIFERLQTSGRISIIFNLKTQSNTGLCTEYILKISNPHRYWKHCRTKNEVYVMQYLNEHTTIPVPKVIDYSYDSTTSMLECEYILMEKMYGPTLEDVIGQMEDQTLMKTVTEMIGYIKQLRQLQLPQMNQIGSFSSKDMFLGGCIQDGPTLGPFDTWKEFFIEHLRWSVQRIQTDQQLFPMGKHLVSPLQDIIDRIQTHEDLSNIKSTFCMTHTDLNSSNIIVNENTGKILAILDWEICAMTFNESDIKFYTDWFEDSQRQEQIKFLIQQQQLDWNDILCDIQRIQPYFDVMYSAMYATFYSCTWFENEQTVIEHIQGFLKKAEDAITILNKIESQ